MIVKADEDFFWEVIHESVINSGPNMGVANRTTYGAEPPGSLPGENDALTHTFRRQKGKPT